MVFQDEQNFPLVLKGFLWWREFDLLPVDAPLVSDVSVNLDILPVHRAVNHLRPSELWREPVEPF